MMSDKCDHCVIIDIPKARTFTNTLTIVPKNNVIKDLNKNPIRKPSLGLITNFSLPEDKPLRVDTLKREDVLLPYRLYSKKQESQRHKLGLGIAIYDKYKIINTDLRKRLHVDTPADDVRAVADVYEDYFRCVNGRPLRNNAQVFKSLFSIFTSQLRIRQEIGYRNDDILNFDIRHRQELDVYDQSIKKFKEQVKLLDNFISEDYQKSRAYLNKWEELAVKVDIKTTELQNLANEKFTIMSTLIGLDYMYGLQQKYGRFLYYLSPPIWRAQNRDFARSIEIAAKGFDFGISSEEDTFNVIFEKMLKDCYGCLVRPVLYFTRPDNLMQVFNGIEKQQLHNFSHVTHKTPHTKTLTDGIKQLKNIMAQESAGVANTIKSFEKLLDFSEERCLHLQSKFFKMLNGPYYDNVGASDVLKLKLHLEFCYEKVYFEKPMNSDIMSTAKALENMYMDYSKRIEAISSHKVDKAVRQHFDFEQQKIRRAKVAVKELYFFNRLERDLRRTYALETDNQTTLSVDKSPIRKNIKLLNLKADVERRLSALTDAEKEYLTLFTDWTANDDPAKYLQSFSIKSEHLDFE